MSSRHNAPTALGLVTASQVSRTAAAVAAAALAILASGAATGVTGRADASGTQPQVRLAAAVTLNASVAQGCGSDQDMMSVPEVLQMVIAPSTPNDIKLADKNKDDYLCITASGRRVTDFVDNSKEESRGSDNGSNDDGGGGGGGGGGGDKMPGGGGGEKMPP
jgi:uncharacterized membrane protein YgcG